MLDTVTRADKLIERERLTGAVEASLHFGRGGVRTVLTRQRVPYPFHVTRSFYLDQARPDLATLYLQSAAGGLYRGDRVALSITAGPNSAAHVTTQAATIVHRTHRFPVEQSTRLEVGEHAFLAADPRSFGALSRRRATEITLAASGCAILTDGISHHDPEGLGREGLGPGGFGRSFERYSNAVVVRDGARRILLNKNNWGRFCDITPTLIAFEIGHALLMKRQLCSKRRNFLSRHVDHRLFQAVCPTNRLDGEDKASRPAR